MNKTVNETVNIYTFHIGFCLHRSRQRARLKVVRFWRPAKNLFQQIFHIGMRLRCHELRNFKLSKLVLIEWIFGYYLLQYLF